jgi:hypothetical protein
MTCAAFVAQVIPQAWNGDCDKGCCAAREISCCTVTLGAPAEADSGCPFCAAPVADSPRDANESPCDCQLEARQEQPLAGDASRLPQPNDLAAWVAVDTGSLEALHGLGASRNYVSAALSIPIRPVRILYGVWRN